MNSTLEKIIILAAITAQVLFSGCTQTRTIGQKTRNKVYFQQREVSPSSIRITDKLSLEDIQDPDDLINASENYIEYASFRRDYSSYADQIRSNLNNNEFERADKLVRELADRLKRDENKYAQNYLEKVKNFSYIIYTIQSTEEETSEKEIGVMDAVSIASWTFSNTITAPFDFALSGKAYWHTTRQIEGLPENKCNRLVDSSFDKIRVTPYTERKEILEQNIPYRRLAKELEMQNKR